MSGEHCAECLDGFHSQCAGDNGCYCMCNLIESLNESDQDSEDMERVS